MCGCVFASSFQHLLIKGCGLFGAQGAEPFVSSVTQKSFRVCKKVHLHLSPWAHRARATDSPPLLSLPSLLLLSFPPSFVSSFLCPFSLLYSSHLLPAPLLFPSLIPRLFSFNVSTGQFTWGVQALTLTRHQPCLLLLLLHGRHQQWRSGPRLRAGGIILWTEEQSEALRLLNRTTGPGAAITLRKRGRGRGKWGGCSFT